VPRVDTLTPEQAALIPVVRDDWLSYGLRCAPADREEALAGVAAAYREAKLDPPSIVVWLDSPYAGAIGSWMLTQLPQAQVGDQVWAQVGDQVRAQVWAQVGAQVGDQVGAQVGAQVRDQVRDQVGDQVRDQVRDQVWAQVWAQVGAQVRAQVGDQVGDQVRAQVRAQVGRAAWGQHDYWLSFYDYFRRATKLPACDRLDGLIRIAQTAGWWWPFRGAVVLTERPTQLHRDPQQRLHHETGPALQYPDGWGIWAWHGVRVPQALIEGAWSTQDILREPNAEVRRCAIEKFGWDRFVVDAGLGQVGDTVFDPGNPGHTLQLFDVPEQIYDEPVRVLLCDNATPERDGTRRRFGLTVPADMADPIAAAAWTFNLPADAYRQLIHAY